MSQFNFNDVIEWGALNETEREEILRRPAVMAGDRIKTVVEGILEAVRERGDEALREFSAKFDRTEVKDFRVSAEEVDAAVARLLEDFMAALKTAAANIEKFHSAEVLEPVTVETMPGVVCQQVTRPIGAVGLYIPRRHGSALFHGADARHSCQDRGLRPRHPLLAASDRRSDPRRRAPLRH